MSNKVRNLVGVAAGVAMSLSMVAPALALTAEDIDLLVALGIVSADKAAAAKAAIAGTTTTTTTTSGYTFNTDLTIGSKGADVTALQQILVNLGYLTMPSGVAYGYFGSITKAAVIKYQLAKGITPAAGYFGAITRASVNSLGGTVSSGTGTVVVPTGAGLNVSLAATSPASGSIVAGQAAANVAEFTFTNVSATPAVVTNVTLQKNGVVADTAFSNVYLYQGATRLTDAASISSGKISFNAGSGLFTVPAGSSVTVSVKVDVASDANGQLMGVSLTGVTANVPVSANYPITGASMSTFTASGLAAAVLGTVTPSSAVSVDAGTLNYSIFSAPLTISNKDVWMTRASFKVIGSIPADSLQNVALYVSGNKVATASGVANDYITFDLTASPVKIQTGAKTIEVRADIIKGTDRSFAVSLQNVSDLGLVDSNYNVGIAMTSGSRSTQTISVGRGKVSFTTDPSLSSGNVVAGASNVALARFNLKAYGEDVKVTELTAKVSTTTTNVSLYANGSQIGSSKNLNANIAGTFTLGSSLVIPAGQTVVLEVRADLKDSTGANVATGTQIVATVGGTTGNAQGMSSSQILTSSVPAADQLGVTLTVVGAGLTVAKNASVNNSSALPNTPNQLIGAFVLQANSSEAQRITGLKVNLGGSIDSSIYLSNLKVDISGVGVTSPIQPVATGTDNNISISPFTIAANGSVNVNVYADIGNTSGNTQVATLSVTGNGVDSNIDLTGTAAGQVITVAAGAVGTPVLQSLPASATVLGGVTNSLIAQLNATGTVGTSYITELQFNATGSIAAITVGGTKQSVSSGATTTVTLATPIQINAGNVGATFPIYVDYTTVGGNGGASSSATSSITLNAMKYTTGNTSTTTYLSVASVNMYPVAGMPSVSVVGVSSSLSGTTTVSRVTVTAQGNAVNLVTLPVVLTKGGDLTLGAEVVIRDHETNEIVATGTVASGAITFASALRVETSRVLDIQVGSTLGAITGEGSITTSLGSKSALVWDDIQGGANSLTGATLPTANYPSASVTVRNY